MPERDDPKGEEKQPPKIKLGLNKELEELAQAIPADAPESDPKSATSKIPLAAAEPSAAAGQPAPPKKGTSKIDLSAAQPAPPKSSTTHIDISQAQHPPKRSTTRIDMAQASPPMAAGKARTSKIDLSAARPPAPSDRADGVQPAAPSAQDEEIVETEVPDAAKFATQRIVLEDEDPAQTTKLRTQSLRSVSEVQEMKKRTSRIDLPSSVEEKEADALKRRTSALDGTMPIEPATTEEQPKTIKIKRPGTPKTRIMSKPPVEAAAGVEAPPAEADVQQARKSETARLDLPPDITTRPPTRPKTIRIKRPDGTSARKPLSVSRAAGPGASGGAEAATAPSMVIGAEMEEEESGPGGLFVALTSVALLVALVLVYVLLAQTYALDLPFPGRL